MTFFSGTTTPVAWVIEQQAANAAAELDRQRLVARRRRRSLLLLRAVNPTIADVDT